MTKIENTAKQIWNDRCDDINNKQDIVWYLDEHTSYYPLTEDEYDAVYAILVAEFNDK